MLLVLRSPASTRRHAVALATAIACFLHMPGTAAETPQPSQVQLLPALIEKASWAPASAEDRVTVAQLPGALAVDLVDLTQGNLAQISLKTPLPVPGWADGLVFSVTNRGSGFDMGVVFSAIIEDAQGRRFLYKVTSPKLPHRVQYFPNHHRSKAMRLSVPGLRRPVVAPKPEANVEAETPGTQPVAPLRIAGLQVSCIAAAPRGNQQSLPIFLSDFAFTYLTPRGSAFHYAFDDQERFGELDPLPSITLGQLGPNYGEKFSVSWEVRDRYDGPPILAGGQDYLLDPTRPDFPIQLNRKVEIPVQEKGTYWVKVTRRWSAKASDQPQMIDEYEYRLDVFHGKSRQNHPPLAASAPVPGRDIRINPDRTSTIFPEGEKFTPHVAFWPEAGTTWRLQAFAPGNAKPEKVLEGTFPADAKAPVMVDLDLSDLSPGVYRVRAELLAGGKVIDATEQITAKAEKAEISGAIPAGVPSWKDVLANERSIVYLMPHYDEPDPQKRWTLLQNFLDRAPAITKTVEFHLGWDELEPLPGVYNWSLLDRFIAYAQTKGIRVMVWPSLVGAEPDWLPSYFEEPRNEDGSIFGAPAYKFHGGRLNFWHADVIRKASLRFLAALGEHCRSNPGVLGYYVVTEHPADSPVHNWFVGGSPETQADFRTYCKEKYKTLDAMNARWQTSIKAWGEIGVPPKDAPTPQRLDWLGFLREGIGNYLVQAVETLRKEDPHRIIQVYIEGLDPEHVARLRELGCMTADGGSQYPETFAGVSMGVAEQGLQRRAEEVSVGQWSAMFPTQLDATMFSMLLGGGGNANIKMFLPVKLTDDQLRQPPYSLDRFEKLLPVWNELRQTALPQRSVHLLYDRNAQLLTANSTQIQEDPWLNSICIEAGFPAPLVPLSLATKGPVIVLTRNTTLEAATIDGLVKYVEDGGTLVMTADVGRRTVEKASADWVLLARFEFTPPQETTSDGSYAQALPVAGDVFPETAGSFRLRDTWKHQPAGNENVIATFESKGGSTAISWIPYGKGRVVVYWSSTIVPASLGGYPALRDIARWAGATPTGWGIPASFWTNLLQKKDDDTYYGLVYRSSFPSDRNGAAIDGITHWKLPAGDYTVTELIANQPLGKWSASRLEADGIPASLKPNAVAVYRIEKISSPQ